MSKKHFIQLAERIKENRSDFSDESIQVLADFCQEQSPYFNRERWLSFINDECGPSGGKVK